MSTTNTRTQDVRRSQPQSVTQNNPRHQSRSQVRRPRDKDGRRREEGFFVKYQSALCILTAIGLTAVVIRLSPNNGLGASPGSHQGASSGTAKGVPAPTATPVTPKSSPAGTQPTGKKSDVTKTTDPDKSVIETIALFPSDVLLPVILDNIWWIGGLLLAGYFVREYILDYYFSKNQNGDAGKSSHGGEAQSADGETEPADADAVTQEDAEDVRESQLVSVPQDSDDQQQQGNDPNRLHPHRSTGGQGQGQGSQSRPPSYATFNKNDSRKQPSVSQEEDMVTAMQSFSRASSQANKGGAPQSVNNNYNQQPQNQQDNGHPEWLSPSGAKRKEMKKAKAVLNKVYQALEAKANKSRQSKSKSRASRDTKGGGAGGKDMEGVQLDRKELQKIIDKEFGKGEAPQVTDKTALAFENAYLRQKRNCVLLDEEGMEEGEEGEEEGSEGDESGAGGGKRDSKSKKRRGSEDETSKIMQAPLVATPRTPRTPRRSDGTGQSGEVEGDQQIDHATAWDKLELARMMLRIYMKHNDFTVSQLDQLHALNEDMARKIALVIQIVNNQSDDASASSATSSVPNLEGPSQQGKGSGSRMAGSKQSAIKGSKNASRSTSAARTGSKMSRNKSDASRSKSKVKSKTSSEMTPSEDENDSRDDSDAESGSEEMSKSAKNSKSKSAKSGPRISHTEIENSTYAEMTTQGSKKKSKNSKSEASKFKASKMSGSKGNKKSGSQNSQTDSENSEEDNSDMKKSSLSKSKSKVSTAPTKTSQSKMKGSKQNESKVSDAQSEDEDSNEDGKKSGASGTKTTSTKSGSKGSKSSSKLKSKGSKESNNSDDSADQDLKTGKERSKLTANSKSKSKGSKNSKSKASKNSKSNAEENSSDDDKSNEGSLEDEEDDKKKSKSKSKKSKNESETDTRSSKALDEGLKKSMQSLLSTSASNVSGESASSKGSKTKHLGDASVSKSRASSKNKERDGEND